MARAARTFRPVRAAGGFNFRFLLSPFPHFLIRIPVFHLSSVADRPSVVSIKYNTKNTCRAAHA
jgi:hypothetical protein